MKNTLVVLSLMAGLAAQGAPKKDATITCIASDGLTLTIPDHTQYYMQPIRLTNEGRPHFLQALIDRHDRPDTTDHDLDFNINWGSCTQVSADELKCVDPTGFGWATYGFRDHNDFVSVQTAVGGNLSLTLVKNNQGDYEMDFSLTNTKLGSEHKLEIKKVFGPKNDPTQTSLTPWTPGCSIPN